MLRRAVFSDVQRKALEKTFQKQKYISKPDRKKLASKLGLKDSQVRTPSTAPPSSSTLAQVNQLQELSDASWTGGAAGETQA